MTKNPPDESISRRCHTKPLGLRESHVGSPTRAHREETWQRHLTQFSLNSARSFADKYRDASSEKRLGQSFWRHFFTQVVAIEDLMSAGIEFEYPVRSASGTINFIDVFWPAVLLIEQKSEGKSLDDAEKQARDYLIALSPALRPPTIVVSDFKRIRIVEVLAGNTFEFTLDSIVENLPRLELAIGKLRGNTGQPVHSGRSSQPMRGHQHCDATTTYTTLVGNSAT